MGSLNREKLATLAGLLVVGGWAVVCIATLDTGWRTMQRGPVMSDSPAPLDAVAIDPGPLSVTEEFDDYHDPARRSPFDVLTAWRPVPAAELPLPPLPELTPVELPPMPSAAARRLRLMWCHDPRNHLVARTDGGADPSFAELARLLESEPRDARHYRVAARAYLRKHAYDHLARLFDLAEHHGVALAELRLHRARFLSLPFVGHTDTAIGLYEGVAADDRLGADDRRQAQLELADLLHDTGQLHRAIRRYRRLCDGPLGEPALAGLCGSLIELGRVAEARELLVRGEGTTARLLELRGVVELLGRTPDPKAAARFLEQSLAIRRRPSAEYNLGLAHLRAGRLDESRVAFRSAVALAPLDPSMGYLGLGELAAAVRANPRRNAMAHYLTGLARARAGDRRRARESLEAAIGIAFDFAAAHLQLGRMAMADGEPQRAVMHLEHAVRVAPAPVALAHLGRAYIVAGELGRAEATLKRDPGHDACRGGVAWIANARGDQRGAERAFRRIETPYARAAVTRIVRNLRREAWVDPFTRRIQDGSVRRGWVEVVHAGVSIRLVGGELRFDATGAGQTRTDRLARLERELPAERRFVSLAARVAVPRGVWGGLQLVTARGGVAVGLTPEGRLFIGRYDAPLTLPMGRGSFVAYHDLGPAKRGPAWTRLRVERDGRVLRIGDAKRTLDLGQPVTRVALFGHRVVQGGWRMAADDVRIVVER